MNKEKRFFEILDEMAVADNANGCMTTQIYSDFLTVQKTDKGCMVTMGAAEEVMYDIINEKSILFLLSINTAAYKEFSKPLKPIPNQPLLFEVDEIIEVKSSPLPIAIEGSIEERIDPGSFIHWQLISEQLPPENVDVLLCGPSLSVTMGWYDGDKFVKEDGEGVVAITTATDWRLPPKNKY